jgi:hypothetical protein
VDNEADVFAASKLMRESGATELLVNGGADGVFVAIGMVTLTANDIVARVIATELDPAMLLAGDIIWMGSQRWTCARS